MTMEVDEARYIEGYKDGWDACSTGQATGEPVGVHEDYLLGWWNGVGECQAWSDGWDAAQRGQHVCPYHVGTDDEVFRTSWLAGYADALAVAREAGHG